MEEKIKELTLLLLYLTSWKEADVFGEMRRSWKGYPFEVLNELTDEDLIRGSIKSKSVYLTETGIKEAKELMEKYLKNLEGNSL
ncbi:transposase [Bacillus sp. IITD106]|nr:transposase [Bacillus sp. IITD106]